MGSLKDEKRGLGEDHQSSKKSDIWGHQAGSESGGAGEGHQRHASQQSTSQKEHQPNLHMSASSEEERDKTLTSKDQGLSGVDGGTSEPLISDQAKACAKTDVMPLTPQPSAPETTATQNNAAISIDPQSHGKPEHSSDREKVSVPPTPDPSDPLSPAPFGQQHMRTQVSLEVVQCHSAATSPMTPPEGGQSFFFPSTFAKCEGVAADTKDAELQVGQQVELCSVATSPMTPKTPSTTAFPMLVGKETAQKGMRKDKEQNRCREQESFAAAKGQVETESEGSSTGCLTPGSIHSSGTCEDGNQQCKQQRMGSMDQDITILVTQHENNEEEDENKEESHFSPVDQEMVKIEEHEDEKCEDRKEAHEKSNQKQSEEQNDCSEAENSELTENTGAGEKAINISGTKPPESPAPFGCQNIRTQVSLEVVQCHSVATSPMTPPEGDQAFYFPSSFGKFGFNGAGTKDAEMQASQQVEYRSVATAPMTPRTPIATTFPEIKKEVSTEEKILEEKEEEKDEEEENKKEQLTECPEKKCEGEEIKKEEDKTDLNSPEEDEKSEEPVQEVSWDEKGMTWEVYGAVVEVAVLGSAIQKHLEKQVLKQKQQSSVEPPEPSEAGRAGSGKGRARKKEEEDGKGSRRRRNPFRGLMENVQQPHHCCTRAHTSE